MTNTDIKLTDVARFYKKLPHQNRALAELDAKVKLVCPAIVADFQFDWRLEQQLKISDISKYALIKLGEVPQYYQALDHQVTALNKFEERVRQLYPQLLKEFQDTWRREPQPEIGAAQRHRGNGQCVDIPVGRVWLSDPIFPGSNFFWWEALHGGSRIPQSKQHCGNIIAVAKKVQIYREKMKRRFLTQSWYRPEPHNSRAGGAKQSCHLTGLAGDWIIEGLSGRQARQQIGSAWEGGIGTYSHFPNIIHLDAGADREW